MMTSPDLTSLPSDDLVKRIHKKDQIITMLVLLVICSLITAFSVGFATGFVTKSASHVVTKN
jgi:predicted MFS family arabinose efflux permease